MCIRDSPWRSQCGGTAGSTRSARGSWPGPPRATPWDTPPARQSSRTCTPNPPARIAPAHTRARRTPRPSRSSPSPSSRPPPHPFPRPNVPPMIIHPPSNRSENSPRLHRHRPRGRFRKGTARNGWKARRSRRAAVRCRAVRSRYRERSTRPSRRELRPAGTARTLQERSDHDRTRRQRRTPHRPCLLYTSRPWPSIAPTCRAISTPP